MRGTNSYWQQLSAEELSQGAHRNMVGGLWEEIGQLQFDFLCLHGLMPRHLFLDVGCGALRGGIHFVRYLEPGRYHGLDINVSLLEGGKLELERAGLLKQAPRLLCDGEFAFERFEVHFDFALAVSVFTHLHLDQIQRCLCAVGRALAEDGVFYATYFPAPTSAWIEPIAHSMGIITYMDSDPFHQHVSDYRYLASNAGLSVEVLGDWGHPRGQHMLAFRKSLS